MAVQEDLNIKQVEAAKKGIAYIFKATKLTTSVLLAALHKLLRAIQENKSNGYQEVEALVKSGAQINTVSLEGNALDLVYKNCKEVGVDFSILKDSATDPPTYTMYFKSNQADVIQECLKKSIKDLKDFKEKGEEVEKPSVKEKIENFKKAVAEAAKEAKVKFKDRAER